MPCCSVPNPALITRSRLSWPDCAARGLFAPTRRVCGSTDAPIGNWVFQNDQVVIHVVRNSRAASVVTDVMAGHRPRIWVSDLYGAQQGHADLWQVCLAHQLRDCTFAIEAGDTVFAPRMKRLLLRAVVLARRRKTLAESTRRAYLRRLDHELNTIMVPGTHQPARQAVCANVTARCVATCSRFSNIPTPRQTTTAANGNCDPQPHTARSLAASDPTGVLIYSPPCDRSSALPRVGAWTRIRQFTLFWTGETSFSRVEQLRSSISGDETWRVVEKPQ